MKHAISIITIIGACCISPGIKGQHFTIKEFNRSLPAHKTAAESIYVVETGYPATGILLKVDEKENFAGSFMVVNHDTLRFTEGEEGPAGDNKKFSNLLTFSVPIRTFLFCPGRIQTDIQFYYINAQQTSEGSTTKSSKKKRFRLCRTRHD